jgi:hypothetical protein
MTTKIMFHAKYESFLKWGAFYVSLMKEHELEVTENKALKRRWNKCNSRLSHNLRKR